jgi:hypothetical protein
MSISRRPSITFLPICVAALSVLADTGASLAAKSAPSSGPTVEWALTDRLCNDLRGSTVVGCGNYGLLHADLPLDTPCTVLARGSETGLPVYAYPKKVKQWVGPVQPAPSPQMATAPASIAVLDFASTDHGSSVLDLIELLAGATQQAELLAIDAASLNPFGTDPNDLHVAAQLCSILESVDIAGEPAPLVANLSFGRKASAADPTAPATCDKDTASCQLVKVIDQLRQRGVALVAAGGNHRVHLYPALVSGVIAAGGLNTRALLDNHLAEPSWETPERMDGHFVANGLCLDADWPVPSGTSYAAASLSGVLAHARSMIPEFDPYQSDGLLYPQWIESEQCFALHQDGKRVGACNRELTDLYAAIDQENPSLCWTAPKLSVEVVESVTSGSAPRWSPPFPTYVATELVPAPEEDPCLPCVEDDDPPLSNDLHIDVSLAEALDANKFVDRVELRAGSSYYKLSLSPLARTKLKDGTLDRLTIPGGKSLIAGQGQPSLIFTIFAATNPIPPDANSGVKCPSGPSSGGSCYWTSSPILTVAPAAP